MCLHIEGIFRTRALAQQHVKTPLIAKRNITVYKVLEKVYTLKPYIEFVSPHRCTPYLPNEIKTAKKFSFRYIDACGWRIEINKGLHSYGKDRPDVQDWHRISKKSFHKIIVKCIIPKGTPYYKNKSEYVSLKLEMPNDFLDLWEIKKR